MRSNIGSSALAFSVSIARGGGTKLMVRRKGLFGWASRLKRSPVFRLKFARRKKKKKGEKRKKKASVFVRFRRGGSLRYKRRGRAKKPAASEGICHLFELTA